MPSDMSSYSPSLFPPLLLDSMVHMCLLNVVICIIQSLAAMCQQHYKLYACKHKVIGVFKPCPAKAPLGWLIAPKSCVKGDHIENMETKCPACEREDEAKRARDPSTYTSFPPFVGGK